MGKKEMIWFSLNVWIRFGNERGWVVETKIYWTEASDVEEAKENIRETIKMDYDHPYLALEWLSVLANDPPPYSGIQPERLRP